MSKYQTPAEVAESLQLTAQTVIRMARSGILPSIQLTKKTIRFDPVAVQEALKKPSTTK